MSQEKVNRYKEEKANRKQLMKKKKTERIIRNTCLSVACVAVFGWIGYSAYTSWQKSRPAEVAEIDYTAYTDYLTDLYKSE